MCARCPDLLALAAQVRQAIPLTRHLDFSFRHWQPGRLELTAPLAPNVNDKGTFFAGSQAALLTLAGWALTTVEADQALGPCDVVAVESSLKYLAPAGGDALLQARATPEALERFARRLVERGRATLAVTVTLGEGAEPASRFEAVYLARSGTA